MYHLAITRDFIAQHHLIGGDFGRENELHSHHYRAEVRIEGAQLDAHGYLVDIVEVERCLATLIERFRDRTLNDLPEFQRMNPSLERFARIFYEALQERLPLEGKSLSVRIWENSTDWAAYSL